MIAVIPAWVKKEVVQRINWIGHLGVRSTIGLDMLPSGGEYPATASNPSIYALEVDHGKTNTKLMLANEARMTKRVLIDEIAKSPRKHTASMTPLSGGSSPLSCFGMYVGALRRKKNMSIQDLAKVSGVSMEQIARIELGEASLAEISLALAEISKALDQNERTLTKLIISLTLS